MRTQNAISFLMYEWEDQIKFQVWDNLGSHLWGDLDLPIFEKSAECNKDQNQNEEQATGD